MNFVGFFLCSVTKMPLSPLAAGVRVQPVVPGWDQWVLTWTRCLLLIPQLNTDIYLFIYLQFVPAKLGNALVPPIGKWQQSSHFCWAHLKEKSQIQSSRAACKSPHPPQKPSGSTVNPPEFWKHSPESNSSFFKFLIGKKYSKGASSMGRSIV